jgi:hypothetical protein
MHACNLNIYIYIYAYISVITVDYVENVVGI